MSGWAAPTPLPRSDETVDYLSAVAVGAGGLGVVSSGVAAGSSVEVTVACSHPDPSDTAAAVKPTARAPDACEDFIGASPAGLTTRTGTITADTACVSAQRHASLDGRIYYARRHTFALDTAAAITGTYTIEATTYRQKKTGDYTLAIDSTAVAGCTAHLGTLAAGRTVRNGTVATNPACVSRQRPSTSTRSHHYADWHTFTLDASAWIDIDLARPPASTLDPYVILTAGTPTAGTILGQDDDTGPGLDAKLTSIHLPAGNYTIEATSHSTNDTGTYTLTVTIPIHGLPQHISATVDEQTTVNFNYWPTNARIGLQSRSGDIDYLADLLDIGISAARGEVSLSLAVPLVDTHGLSVTRTTVAASTGASGEGDSATRGSRQVRSATAEVPVTSGFGFSVNAVCGRGSVVSPSSEQLCVSASLQSNPRVDARTALDEGPLYRVTPGALAATIHAAYTGKTAYEDRTDRVCRNMGVNRLAAVMLAIPYWENLAFDSNGVPTRLLARSPMALSRKDVVRQAGELQPRNYRLYSGNSVTSGPARAFWHPGVGSWQIDDTFAVKDEDGNRSTVRVLALDHAERADARIGGTLVAERLLETLCVADATNSDDFLDDLAIAYGPWFGCRGETVPQTCRDSTYVKMYDVERDDLLVTSRGYAGEGPVDGYVRDYSPSGGVIDLNCRWGDAGAMFDCWFFNPGNRQGAMQVYDPEADNADLWKTDPETGERYRSRTPLAAPFLSFTYVENKVGTKFAVFPAAFLAGSTTSWFKAVPDGAGVRGGDYPWQQTSYTFGTGPGAQTRRLQVQVCRAEGTPPAVRNICGWWPVNSSSLVNVFAAAHLTNRTREDPVYRP